MLALVLGGGGAKGAYELGVWRALDEMDIDIDIAVGTSIGSLNAALFVQGDYDLAVRLWNEFDPGKMLEVENYKDMANREKLRASVEGFAKGLFAEGGIDPTEYKRVIQENIDEKAVRASRIRYGAVTVEMENFVPVHKTIEEMKVGQLQDYIVASSSLAPALKPHEIDGKKYIDGGFHDNVPINMAVEMGATDIIAVDLSAVGVLKPVRSPEKIADLKYIKPYWDLGSVLIFEDSVVKRNILLGYLDTLKVFGAFDGNAYTFMRSSRNKGQNGFADITKQLLESGIRIGKTKLDLADKMMKRHWDAILAERNKRGSQKTSEMLTCAEIAAEILALDPTKIYNLDSVNKKIREALDQVELPALTKNRKGGVDIVAAIHRDIAAITDEKIRLKYFAFEIAQSLQRDEEIWIKALAPIFTKEFFAGLYIAIHRLI